MLNCFFCVSVSLSCKKTCCFDFQFFPCVALEMFQLCNSQIIDRARFGHVRTYVTWSQLSFCTLASKCTFLPRKTGIELVFRSSFQCKQQSWAEIWRTLKARSSKSKAWFGQKCTFEAHCALVANEAWLTSLSLSFILFAGWVLRPPVMLRTAPIRYHIRECGLESTILKNTKSSLGW